MAIQFCAGGRIQTVRARQTRIAADFHSARCDVEECARALPAGSTVWSHNGRWGCSERHCETAVLRAGMGA